MAWRNYSMQKPRGIPDVVSFTGREFYFGVTAVESCPALKNCQSFTIMIDDQPPSKSGRVAIRLFNDSETGDRKGIQKVSTSKYGDRIAVRLTALGLDQESNIKPGKYSFKENPEGFIQILCGLYDQREK